MTAPDVVTTLPPPASLRWQPTRAGLVSLWRYADETFAFHRGRLLLRGPNGAGKSMALELLLPFLLDADASASRLTSAAKSRGGLYERVMTGSADPSRAGFAWVEFARTPVSSGDSSSPPGRFSPRASAELGRGHGVFTVGVRLRASTSTRKVDLDFFTTDQAVGGELQLLDDQRVPLSRRDLVAAIGDRGRVHGSAAEHRAAVRERLFGGFAADRYDSVITALLALRKEKLSQNLDLPKLSAVLSEALPPLDEHDVTAVAEGFERLDRRRDELARLEAELAEVTALARRQGGYARTLLAHLAGEVRSAETARDDVTRTERQAQAALEEAHATLSALTGERDAIRRRLAAADAEIGGLQDRDAYREGAALEDLRRQTAVLGEVADRADREARRQADEAEATAAAAEEAAEDVTAAEGNLGHAAGDLHRIAVDVGAEGAVDEAAALAERRRDEAQPHDDVDAAERLVHAWTRGRRDRIRDVRAALAAHHDAVQTRTFAEQQVAADDEEVERRDAARRDAAAALDAARASWAAAVERWAAGCTAVDPDRVRAALPVPVEAPAQVDAALQTLRRDLHGEHRVAVADLERRRAEAQDQRVALQRDRDEVAAGVVEHPPPPAWRDDRTDRPGAPLWQLLDPAADLPTGILDGIEAALEAAGLLDAWVEVDGRVAVPDAADLLLTRSAPAGGRHLGDLLQPLPDAAVPADVVASVLAAIPVTDTVAGAGDGRVVIGTDGTFRLGPAVGRGRRRPAVLLGAAARERRRLERLAALDAEIGRADAHLGALAREDADLDRTAAARDADLAAVPPGDLVDDAAAALQDETTRLDAAAARMTQSRRRLGDAEEEVRRALRTLTTLASQHRLPTDGDALDAIAAALEDLDRATTTWGRRLREARSAARHRDRTDAQHQAATAAARDAARAAADRRRQADQVSARLQALETSVGAEYGEIVAAITALQQEAARHRTRADELDDARPALDRRIGELDRDVAEAARRREAAEAQRVTTHQRLVAAIGDGLAGDTGLAVPDVVDTATAVLAAARDLAAALDGQAADQPALRRQEALVQEAVHQAQTSLGGRVDLLHELTEHGWWVLRASVSGLRRGVGDLRDALDRELAAGRDELAAEEERLFEQTLAGSVRRALASRIRLANELVAGINRQLDQVRTAAGGVAVRLGWEVDPEQPDAVRSARALLLRDPADLDEGERAALQDFVRARVDQARAELAAHAPWEARLRETLDYRAWHRFTLQIAHRDWEGYQPATPRRLQRLSTGERSIALHLPMLASIAAHYTDEQGEPSGCPRLILLDELFAGVDTANRSQLFGTFTAWDLDAVFTSDHEWCQYATLDGIAIHHLHPPTGEEPVTTTRFTWDGRRRTVDQPAA